MLSRKDVMIAVLLVGLIIFLSCMIVIAVKSARNDEHQRDIECNNKGGTYLWHEQRCLDVQHIDLSK